MCGNNKANPPPPGTIDSKSITIAPSEIDCGVDHFNTTGCNITLAGKLLIVLDGVKKKLENGLYCFCKQVNSHFNGTNVSTEVLTGSNKGQSCSSVVNERVNETFLQDELKSLNSEYAFKDGQAGMALILSDRANMSTSFDELPNEEQEPFILFITFEKQMDAANSCYRQYRYIQNMFELSNIGLELERNACDPKGYLKNNSCAGPTTYTTTISASSSQVKMPLAVLSVIGALVLAVVIVLCLIFSPKCRRKTKSRKETSVEFSAVDSGFVGLTEHVYSEAKMFPSSSRGSQNICTALWEKEETKNNKKKDENYQDLDMNFVEDNIDPSLFDRLKGEEDLDDIFEAPG